ncbi:OadG family protein [Aestuariibacter salexigens]|uniref:OadG family protein n=1 Tax=Aestuariibacter salexigens TaxID=226010 RepID=UPI0003F63205|nr:OadG family protein [Aestuariibacter salexigens]
MESAQVINLLLEAAALLAVGMTVVFIFLTVLIASVHALSAFCQRFSGAAEQQPSPSVVSRQQSANGTSATVDDSDVVAAISAAIHQHRHRQ